MYALDAVKRNGDVFNYYLASRVQEEEELQIRNHLNRPDGVGIYAVHGEDHDKLVLVRQYRYPIGDYIFGGDRNDLHSL